MDKKVVGLIDVKSYYDPSIFTLEQDKIFSRGWLYAGPLSDLEKSGDYFTAEIGSTPIIVIKSRSGEIRSFVNICKHRGAPLLRGDSGNIDKIICPYHGWSYDIENNHLTSIPLTIWNGLIFISLEEDPKPIDIQIGGIKPYFAFSNQPLLEDSDSFMEYYIDANWKLIAENFVDTYHLPHLHKKSLNIYNHSEIYSKTIDGNWISFDPFIDEYQTGKSEVEGSYVYLLFPNLGLNLEMDKSFSIFHITPISPERSKVTIRGFYPKDWGKSSNFRVFKKREVKVWEQYQQFKSFGENRSDFDPLNIEDFMVEDIYTVEKIQKVLRSPFFGSFNLGAKEESIIKFQQFYLGLMENSFRGER